MFVFTDSEEDNVMVIDADDRTEAFCKLVDHFVEEEIFDCEEDVQDQFDNGVFRLVQVSNNKIL